MSLVGRTLGQYQIVSELGRGQRAVVYQAWQTNLERHVALKVLTNGDTATLRKLEIEAQRTAQLIQQEVPNLRRVYEVGRTTEGDLYVALEFVDDSLQNRLRMDRERCRRFSPGAAVRLLRPVAEALDAMHRLGWVHLDIKPQNILISRNGRAVLADLGIVQRVGASTGACTPAYASPEQADRHQPVRPQSDVYSLAVVVYEMLTGSLPFQAEHELALLNQHLVAEPPSPRMLNPGLGAREERALLKALSKAPEQRQKTATALLDSLLPDGSLSAARGGVQSHARAESAGASRPIRRRLLLCLIAALAVLVTVVAGMALWPRRRSDDSAVTPGAPVTGTALRGSPAVQMDTTPTREIRESTPKVVIPVMATVQDVSTATLVPIGTPRPRPTSTAPPPARATDSSGPSSGVSGGRAQAPSGAAA